MSGVCPGLYGVVAAHAPETVFGKFDHAYDEAQVFYAALAGLEADELLMLIDENAARMEADGAEVAEYIAPGDGHTILDSDAVYDARGGGCALHRLADRAHRGRRPSRRALLGLPLGARMVPQADGKSG